MTLWICALCGIEHADTVEPPNTCVICSDERQYLLPEGQRWTTITEIRNERTATFEELEPDLYGINVTPKIGIGQRPLLIRTPAGNLLWEPPGFYDDAFVAALNELGGVAAITASHPHLTGVAVSLSHAFGNVPFYWGADDERWIRRPDGVIRLWSGTQEVLPGLTLVQCGGHFAGSAVLHWANGAEGKGILITGDTIYVVTDRNSATFMRSYPNMIPLSPRSVEKIMTAIEPLAYDRVYSGFAPGLIATDAKARLRYSADRYIGWVRDEIRDPDERI